MDGAAPANKRGLNHSAYTDEASGSVNLNQSPAWVTRLLKTGASAEALRCVFKEHYDGNALGYDAWAEFLEASAIKDATVNSEGLSQGDVHRVYYTHTGVGASKGLSMEGFLNALASVSLVKYPSEKSPSRALQMLVDHFLIPYGRLLGGHTAKAANAAGRMGTDPVVVSRVRNFIIGSGNAEDLSAIFTAYSSPSKYGDRLDSRMFLRLCRESRIVDEDGSDGLTFDAVQNVFMTEANLGNPTDAGWLRPDQFISAIISLAVVKFDTHDGYTAAVRLITGFVLPFADHGLN